MLLTISLPIVDVRPLLGTDTGRNPLPAWPRPDRLYARTSSRHHQGSFVAGLGAVRPRLRGMPGPWPVESCYVDVRSRIRVEPRGDYVTTSSAYDVTHTSVKPMYRHFYTDGVAGRLEVGFSSPSDLGWPAVRGVGVIAARAFARIRDTQDVSYLIEFGPQFAAYYLRATTSRAWTGGEAQSWWIGQGLPSIVLYETAHEDRSLELIQSWLRVEGVRARIWLLRRGATSEDHFRRLRIHLSRLNTDIAAFEAVMAMCQAERFTARQKPEIARWLAGKVEVLLRAGRHGYPQADLFARVLGESDEDYERLVTALDEIDSRLADAQLHTVIQQLRALALDGFRQRTVTGPEIQLSYAVAAPTPHTTYEYHIHDSIIQSSVLGSSAAQDAPDRDRSSAVVKLLEELQATVSDLAQRMNGEDAVAVTGEVAALSAEIVASPEENKRSIKNRLRTLLGFAIQAGAVGDALTKVVTAISGVLTL